MTDRRHAHATRQRHDNAADTDTRHACAGNPWPYDVLIDLSGGTAWQHALREARRICGTCPLWRTCLAENRDEPWAQAIITNRSRHGNAARCGTPAGYRNHLRHDERPCADCRNAERDRSAGRREKAA